MNELLHMILEPSNEGRLLLLLAIVIIAAAGMTVSAIYRLHRLGEFGTSAKNIQREDDFTGLLEGS